MRKKVYQMRLAILMNRYIEEAADFQRKKKRTGKSSILQKERCCRGFIYTCIYIICFDIGSCGFFSGL